jgi:hypothetical protein
LFVRSGSNARGCRGRFLADKASWNSVGSGEVVSGMRPISGT